MATLTIRLDENLKKEAETILESYGLSPAQAVKMLFTELSATRSFPLTLAFQKENDAPNAITQRAIRELENGIYTESTLDELLKQKNA